MMLSTTVFAIALVGLVALFWCKTLELNQGSRTPLQSLRRIGDPILVESWAYYSARCKKAMFKGLYVSILGIRSGIQKVEATFDATVHVVATRLNRYLRMRRLHMRHGGEVSTHLKTVLEKTERNAAGSDSL